MLWQVSKARKNRANVGLGKTLSSDAHSKNQGKFRHFCNFIFCCWFLDARTV